LRHRFERAGAVFGEASSWSPLRLDGKVRDLTHILKWSHAAIASIHPIRGFTSASSGSRHSVLVRKNRKNEI
jgi:hypothetical protein